MAEPARTVREVRNELSELTAEHLKHLETATYIPMSKQQMFDHWERLDRIRKLSNEYLALLGGDDLEDPTIVSG